MRIALRAGILRRPRIDADDEGAGIERRLRQGEHDVGIVDAGEDLHLVALDHLVGELAADVGLRLIVAVDDHSGTAAELSAEALDAELEAVEQLLAEHAARAREGRDEADLDRLLSRRRAKGQQRQQGGGRYGFHVHPRESSWDPRGNYRPARRLSLAAHAARASSCSRSQVVAIMLGRAFMRSTHDLMLA